MKQSTDEESRYLARDTCERLIDRVRSFARDGGQIAVEVTSWWNGELRWARNRVNLAGDRRNTRVSVTRVYEGAEGSGSTNQLDDVSLEALVRATERRAREPARQNIIAGNVLPPPQLTWSSSTIWSDTTYAATAAMRAEIARLLSDGAETQEMLSSGYLETRAGSWSGWSDLKSPDEYESHTPTLRYERLTQAQCSMTVRHPKGTGSGWAGHASFDYTAIKSVELAKRALDKCIASLNPVRIEPGRYTLIMEPQATCELVECLMARSEIGWRESAESFRSDHPLYLGIDDALRIGLSKLGLQIVDNRITIDHDPADPVLGVVPGAGMQMVRYIDRGVLQTIGEGSHRNARMTRRKLLGDPWRPSFQMSGGPTSMDEMIRTTKRGLLVTRFSNMTVLDFSSILMTGVTRDGLWLIENGRITKSVWNMRFTESPLFVLNQVDQLGMPVPVFRPVKTPASFGLTPAVVPPMKVNDFSFTSLVDAV